MTGKGVTSQKRKGAGRGRKRQFTPEEKETIMRARAIGLGIKETAFLLQTSDKTLQREMELSPQWEMGRDLANNAVGNALFDSALKGNVTAQIFWLKARAGWREADRFDAMEQEREYGAIEVPAIAGPEDWAEDARAYRDELREKGVIDLADHREKTKNAGRKVRVKRS